MLQSYPAPAKINLFLHIIGRRADGYHLLQSVFRFVDFGDSLQFEIRDDGKIQRVNALPGLNADDDLCVRAARLLQQHSGSRVGVDITLDKRLPMGGGLGGGSSDAATTLLVLNRLWGLDLPRHELQALGLQLGADVPVFVFGETAFVEGVGEKLQAMALPPAWYVVLIPPVHVSTAKIFTSQELTRDTIPIKMSDFSKGYGHNDLETVVCQAYPEVANYLAWLKLRGDARMTGSGACIFASYETEQEARAVFAQKSAEMAGFVACGLDQHPLRGFAD